MKIEDWTGKFKGTLGLPPSVREDLQKVGRVSYFKKGTQVFGPNNIPENLIFLYDGCLRVSQTSIAGREIVLYRVDAGESCVLTTACMLAEEAYNAEGIAETDVTAIILPKADFDRLASEHASFRNFVFAAYSRRLIDLLRVVDDVAFGRMDLRLAEKLLALAGDSLVIQTTHQDLANELGTAREVVSRILNDFQKREMIEQSRGRINLLDRARLASLSNFE